MAKGVKKAIRKLRYLDKTKLSYFIVTTFIAAFFLFTGVTYSYFVVSNNMGNATITIAKLNYTLSSNNEEFSDGVISVPAEETVFLDLELKSHNDLSTRYAVTYESDNDDINVYYSEDLKKNVSGIIGPSGSIVNMRLVLENNSDEDEDVNIDVSGGYLQNNIESNITAGYFEHDEVIRYVVYDEEFENSIVKYSIPSKNDYSYYKSECSNDVDPSFDEENWEFNSNRGSKKTSCDVYFKKATNALEKYYNVLGSNGLNTYSKVKPDTNGLYHYVSASCSNNAEYSFNQNTFEFNIVNYDPNTLCVANFTTDIELESADRYIVTFDSNGGDRNYTKVVRPGGTYGELPDATNGESFLVGWFTDPVDGELIENTTVVNISGPQTLYAHWNTITPLTLTSSNLSWIGYNGQADLVIPETVEHDGTTYRITQIGNGAFLYKTSLKSIVIPDSVTYIDELAFYNCSNLKSVTMSDDVTFIGKMAFQDCAALESINMPSALTSIESQLFCGCSNLTRVTIPSLVTSIGAGAFSRCGISTIRISNIITSIGERAFYNCLNLTAVNVDPGNNYFVSIDGVLYNKDVTTLLCYPCSKPSVSFTIPSTVDVLPVAVFGYARFLEDVTIPGTISDLGGYTFTNCTSLKTATLGDGITAIADEMFYECTSLTSVTFPNNIKVIGWMAFYNCSSLLELTIPSTVYQLGGDVFAGCTSLVLTLKGTFSYYGTEPFADVAQVIYDY